LSIPDIGGTRWSLPTRQGAGAKPAETGIDIMGAAFAAGSSQSLYVALRGSTKSATRPALSIPAEPAAKRMKVLAEALGDL
jgi:hypothetical protein